ncbi:MAG: EAL domain-containing protein [Burkholderiales bacterium]|nr:EAL domain-containing protein [Burkholderiales bacterium]
MVRSATNSTPGTETCSARAGAAAAPASDGPAVNAHTPVVLVVDDDQITRLVVAETLTPQGFRVVEAACGEDALDAFSRMRPDAILLDINMPGMNGFECCERIRRLPHGERVPILILTVSDDDASIARAYEVGATDFAAKPISWKLLGHRMRYLLRASRALESRARSEARFRSLVHLSSDWYWEQDESFRFTLVSQEGAAKSGVARAHALGKACWEMHEAAPAIGAWEDHRATLLARQPFRDFEYVCAGDDGQPRHVSTSGEPIFDGGGRFRGYRGVGHDITGRKLAEQQLAADAARQKWIAGFGQRALETTTLETLLAQAVQATDGASADGAAVLEYLPPDGEAERGRFVVRAASGVGADAPSGAVVTLCDACGVAAALRSEAPVIVPSCPTARCEQPAGRARGCASRASVSVPILGEAGPFAVLTMVKAGEASFSDDAAEFVQTVGNIVSSAVQRHQAEARLAYLAQYDSITGLANRNLLRDRLDQAIALAARDGRQVAVLFADLDRFKLVNDTYGHHLGDRLLAEVGARLRALVRASDTLARVSGDEFVAVLPNVDQAEAAANVAQKVLARLGAPFRLGGHEVSVNASVGIALYPADGADAESLLKSADAALYRAKDLGRGAYCFFTAEMERRSHARRQVQADLRLAIEREEFTLVYQPRVDLATRRVRGVEALLRWQHPHRGTVSPADFIPALEETGLIVPAGEWVVRAACRQIRAWRQAGLVPVPVSVNVSARQFQARNLDQRIVELVAGEGVDPRLLELEITESYLMQDPEHAIEALQRLREAGLQISIDDFGTGYSSLAHLPRFPVTALKVDRSFVRDATSDPNAAAIVRAVIDMAHTLGFAVVAEGVETAPQVAFLRMHRCDLAQGYYFGKPARPDDVAALLRPRSLVPAGGAPDFSSRCATICALNPDGLGFEEPTDPL